MKIAYFYLGTKGVCDEALELAKSLSKNTNVLCIISSYVENYPFWIQESKDNQCLNILNINVGNTVSSGFIGLFNIPLFINTIRTINTFAPDVVFSYMGHPWERMIVPYLRCKFTMRSIHDPELHVGERSIKNYLINLFDYKSKKYVTYSHYSKKELIKKGYNGDDIVVIHISCNSFLVEKNKNLDIEKKERFLFWGRIEKYKGVEVLLASLENVFKSHPHVKLIMAGRGDLRPYMPIIRRFPHNIEVNNYWIPNENIESFFRRVDFVVLPYISATQSGVPALSYSYGKPVIASDSGALPEQVKDGVTGKIFDNGDASSLSKVINYMLDNDSDLVHMKKEAYKFSKELSWDASAKILLKFINDQCLFE